MWWWGQYTHTCVPTATIHGELTCGGGGQYTHTCVPIATIHGVPYTVYSRVVVGAIYTYMCTYSHRTQSTVHSELMCGGGGNIHIHVYLQLPYMVHRTWCTVHNELTCGGGIHVWELLTCAGDIHVWELLTCETSHQSEILHSLIFYSNSCFCVRLLHTCAAPASGCVSPRVQRENCYSQE